ERAPRDVALVFEDSSVTYAALNARANRLARELRARGVGVGARVGVAMDRGPDPIVAILAVLKAGAAYVPLDPSYPEARLRFMVADAELPLVLTHQSLLHPFAGTASRLVAVDALGPHAGEHGEGEPLAAGDP